MRERSVIVVLSLSLVAGCGGMPVNHVPVPGSQAATSTAPIGSEENPMRVSGGVMAGLILHKEWPVYPAEAVEKKVSGAVVLAVTVDPWGKVSAVRVISGPEVLRDSYSAAVQTWTYKPYLLNGQPVYVQMTVTVVIDH